MSVVPLVGTPSDAVAVALNAVTAAGASVGAGYWAHRLPGRRVLADGPLLRLRRWEAHGDVYERRLAVRRWKDRLPDAGAFFAGGRSKRRLGGTDAVTLAGFAAETRRAERSHWVAAVVVIVLAPLWNRWPGVALMAGYGLAFNAPCIVVQRYNRARLAAVADRRSRRAVDPRSSASRAGS